MVKNGHNKCGNQQYHCHDCNAYGVLEPDPGYTPETKDTILRTYQERASLRGLHRIFGVARQTVSGWLMHLMRWLPDLRDTVVPAQPDDILELDELGSFVGHKGQERWLWTAICRRTRQIVAFVIGDRSYETWVRWWNKIPVAYQRGHTFSDFYAAYQQVLPATTHRSVDKASGQTMHMERWYCTLRQRLARFVRKTLSFSKADKYHHIVTKWFITEYNLSLSLTT